MAILEVTIAGINLKNPVLLCSGCSGSGEELSEFFNLSRLGAFITKSVTLTPRNGNPPPRTAETPSGMLNTIGLQNDGIESLIAKQLPYLSKFKIPIIVNIAGESIAEYEELAKILNKQTNVSGIEVNISCPNIQEGGMFFGCDPKLAHDVIAAVRNATQLPVIAKLTPNVTDIKLIAKAVADAGADAISLINTVLGMAIDIKTRKPSLSMKVGGLSGPAIKPIAVRCVYEAAQAVDIPIIGIGGIMTWEDAIEFFLAGASAVEIGTASFVDPAASIKIIEGINHYLDKEGFKSLKDLFEQRIT